MNMLDSYSSHMGNDTSIRVKMSEVGVIMAAIISITTIACLRYLRMNAEDRNPIFANNHASTGISNTMPMDRHININVLI